MPIKGEVAEVGKVLELAYGSKKWDKKSEGYLHEFRDPPKMYLHEDEKTLIVHPIEFTKHGITS